MIELHHVTKRYESLTAVDDVSFTVKPGECFALLGPNGAGKTTIVKMLLDFTRPTSGSLSINGILSTQAECRRSIGYLAENHRIPSALAGWQYLLRCAELLDMNRSGATEHSGLDPIGIRELRLLLESLKGQGMTIFLNSHLLSEVEKLCDTAAIINRGKLLVKDAIAAIVRDGETLEDVFVRLVKG